MICLDNTDTLEGGASVDAVVDYTVHGLVGTTFTQLAAGQLSNVNPSVLYTAEAGISIVSIVFVNTYSDVITVDLYLDPANGGTPRRLIPKTLSLGIGYSMHFDGQRCSILDASGNLLTSFANLISDTAYGAGWDGVTTIAPSKNVVYDEVELRAKAAASLGDNKLIRGDGGVRGIQESTVLVSDTGEMTNPSQPCFNVKPTAAQVDIAVSTNVTIIFGTERFDIGNNFASDIFTAPITGKYQFNVILRLDLLDTDAAYYWMYLVTSNFSYNRLQDFDMFATDPNYRTLTLSVLADMDANDTAFVRIYQSGGVAQTDINANSNFSGALIC